MDMKNMLSFPKNGWKLFLCEQLFNFRRETMLSFGTIKLKSSIIDTLNLAKGTILSICLNSTCLYNCCRCYYSELLLHVMYWGTFFFFCFLNVSLHVLWTPGVGTSSNWICSFHGSFGYDPDHRHRYQPC